eukprot:4565118-Amphidinium_carterae.1
MSRPAASKSCKSSQNLFTALDICVTAVRKSEQKESADRTRRASRASASRHSFSSCASCVQDALVIRLEREEGCAIHKSRWGSLRVCFSDDVVDGSCFGMPQQYHKEWKIIHRTPHTKLCQL